MAPMAQAPPPAVAPAAASQHGSHSASGKARWRIYTVQPGDTLWALARRFDTSVTALRDRNHSWGIKAGQHIAVPAAAPGRSTAPALASSGPKHRAAKRPTRHTVGYAVRSGDTLTSIAQAHHTTVSALMKANRLSSANLVRAGQRLRVPTTTLHAKSAKTRHTPKKAHPRQKPLTKAERTFGGYTYPERVVRAALSSRAYLAGRPAPSRTQVHRLIVAAAHRYGVNPKVALGIAWQESGWNQRAVSIAGAIGVMQVMPATGTWASDLAGHRLNLLDAHDNVTAGVVVLRYLTGHAKNLDDAIGGYYQGLGGVQEHGMLPGTKAYVRAVHAHMSRF